MVIIASNISMIYLNMGNQLEHVTTGDILVAALNKGYIDEATGINKSGYDWCEDANCCRFT